MTLPAKKYRSWEERVRRGKILLAFIIAGVVGIIIPLIVLGEKGWISLGIPIENAIGAFWVQLLLIGSLVPVYLIFNKISPGWRTRRNEKYSRKLLTLFIIAVVISVVTSYVIFAVGPESIFVKSQQESDHINIGNKLFNDGKYQEAISYYDRALIREPDNVQVINQKGVALSLLGLHQEALSLYDKALENDPNYVNAIYNKGNAFHGLERYQEAIIWYDKALEINPNDVLALYNKGSALFSLGRYQEAITWYDKALEINPNDVIVLEQKGHAFFSLEKYQEAIIWYDKALDIEQNNNEILSYKNEALSELQKDKIQTLYELSKQE